MGGGGGAGGVDGRGVAAGVHDGACRRQSRCRNIADECDVRITRALLPADMPHRRSFVRESLLPVVVVCIAANAATHGLAAQSSSQGSTAAAPSARSNTDSVPTYASPALELLVGEAARRNKVPPDLLNYSADVETEIAVLIRRADGTEAVAAVEQIASGVRWQRTGLTEQHVIGHRMQQVGASVSMMSLFTNGWLNPTLYGNRLRAQRPPSDSAATTSAAEGRADRGNTNGGRSNRTRNAADTFAVIHPLADDRDAWYVYTAGDTVVTLQAGERRIPIVRVQVEPRADLPTRASLFRGELHLDVSRGALVRLRGTFVRAGPWPRSKNPLARLAQATVDAIGFVEFENAERVGRYWLPSTQRVELQASAPPFGDARAVVRIMSRFGRVTTNDPDFASFASAGDSAAVLDSISLDSTATTPGDSTVRRRRRLSFASSDSMSKFGAWNAELGQLTEGQHADDFDDIGPDRWRATGLPRLDWTVPFASDLVRYNRVEGLFTGFGARLALRDVAPGVTARVNAGYAWSEQTVRARAELARTRGEWKVALRGGRSLDITNDFRNPVDSGNTLGALFGQDEYDYVDRTGVGLLVVRTEPSRRWQWRGELGVARDGQAIASREITPFGRLAFRPNRGVDEGTYTRAAVTLAWRPDGSAEFMSPGISARLYAEGGAGDLNYQRVEARVSVRKPVGPFIAAARGDIGALFGTSLPAQQLFELGRTQGLPGYEYKEFAGTRSALVRGLLLYSSPFLRNPMRWGSVWLPGLNPGASIGVQTGWTGAPGADGQAAVARLGLTEGPEGVLSPVSRTSDIWRASVSAGLRFYSGSVFVGGARTIDGTVPWRWLISFGQQL